MIYNKQKLIDSNGYLDLFESEIKGIADFVIANEKKNSNSRYLEIGVFGGGTIRFLKENTKTTQFVGIDLFETYAPMPDNTHMGGAFSREDVQDFLGDRVHLICGSSHIVLPTLNEKFDFIFIDGNHTYAATKQDFLDASKLLTEYGQIAFHNASTTFSPDDMYVKADGGPWKVCEELRANSEWKQLAEKERLVVFGRR
jgi:predicted O-methyltransferase YrrM